MMVSTEKKNSYKEKIATITDWHSIDWKRAERQVRILQKKISDAYEQKAYRAAKRLQYVLSNSFYAKALAVRQVTGNKGKNTAGTDGKVWSTPKLKMEAASTLNQGRYTAKPLRRIYIPKSSGKDQLRPLSIPTMYDRAMQRLYAYGFEPISELHADGFSYGFRKYRSTQDAVKRIHNTLSKKWSPQWVIDADIKGCFDNIHHQWIIENVPIQKTVLQQWLKCGYIDQKQLFPTEQGVPQGGIISPMITNFVLDGMLDYVRKQLKLDKYGTYTKASLYNAQGENIRPYAVRTKSAKVNMIRYADDFICTVAHQEEIPFVLKAIRQYLGQRGLELHPEKTQIRTINEGFDFLGWNIRQYNGKLLIKPSRKSIQKIKKKIKEVFKEHVAQKQENLIYELNLVLRGWGNYFRTHVSSRVFTDIDSYIWQRTQKWIKRRHPKKRMDWGNDKYFCTIGKDRWVFGTEKGYLMKLQKVKIRRHHLIAEELNYFKNPEKFEAYIATRKLASKLDNPKLYHLYHREQGICPYCLSKIEDHLFDVHHIVKRKEQGGNKWDNLVMLHRNCHRTMHAKKEKLVRLPNEQWKVQEE
ncbi:group II intron reverse transcriptase/maturase [uncultured Microscilla sp.]|uniref:group II intron reverse transcriptase/maturase n=1 Tax=uncultured Microscilla sp. TaxID=432653 RepID=UPI00261B7EDA|nr:group II intron reverse transcriptase/maturase [uncultured Microscilla sp.]